MDGLTVFATIDGALEWDQPLQQDGDENLRTDDWGAYMVPQYLDFDDLVTLG